MEPPEWLEPSIGTVFLIGFVGLFLYSIAELAFIHFRKRALRLREARMAGWGILSQGAAMAAVGALWGPLSVGVAATAGAHLTPLEMGLSWPWWIVGFVIYEFFYWLQHWAAHKVRLLWCMHSPHHAPGGIHMVIGLNHSFLESVFYFPLFFGFIPALFGVHPLILVAVNVLDGLWGGFLHISDEVIAKGRYGLLGRALQTPSHHRVHHAQNVRYMDTNYNSITLLWDWLLGTLQPLRDEEPVVYGITRDVDTGSFLDAHFGEFVLLWRDVRSSASWGDALGYLFHAPGWTPTDDGKTASALKARLAVESLGRG
jgi:sterol desaturase/sphingolipid hydroxylase (fatty acid hydroxylase superfamily)